MCSVAGAFCVGSDLYFFFLSLFSLFRFGYLCTYSIIISTTFYKFQVLLLWLKGSVIIAPVIRLFTTFCTPNAVHLPSLCDLLTTCHDSCVLCAMLKTAHVIQANMFVILLPCFIHQLPFSNVRNVVLDAVSIVDTRMPNSLWTLPVAKPRPVCNIL